MTTNRDRAPKDHTMENREADRTPVTVMGLGLMGQALAEAFVRNGHPTTVWNRTAAKAEHPVAMGARLADSVREAGTASPIIVVCVSDYEAAHEIIDPLAMSSKAGSWST